MNMLVAFYLALAIIGIASLVRGQWLEAVIALVAGIGIWLNELARRPEFRWLSFARYLALGVIAFLIVVTFTSR